VVDDDPLVASSMRRALAREHDVVVVSSGRDALERLLAGEVFDIVFCDLMMPVLSGMELHAEVALRAPSLLDRLVFVTGGAYTDAASEFLARVRPRYLEKPFELQVIRDLAQTALLGAP
jgi:CheY-like chemotaxis protein